MEIDGRHLRMATQAIFHVRMAVCAGTIMSFSQSVCTHTCVCVLYAHILGDSWGKCHFQFSYFIQVYNTKSFSLKIDKSKVPVVNINVLLILKE